MRFKRNLSRDELAELLRGLGYGFAKGRIVIQGGLQPSHPIIPVGPMELELELKDGEEDFRLSLRISGFKGKSLDIGHEGTA